MAIDLLLTAGNGPAECRIALTCLIGEIERAARRDAVSIEVACGRAADRHGPGSAVLTLEGGNAAAVAHAFTGTVRFVFKSPVRPGHKRQNWFVGVIPIETPDPALHHPRLDPGDICFQTFRAGGPGGQHQNTTDSAVRATHVPTGLSVLARDERSQHRNKALALARLDGLLLALADADRAAQKSANFLANRNLQRGNAIQTFRPDL